MTPQLLLPPITTARRWLTALMVGLLCSAGGPAWAQRVTNPTTMEFDVSPDHFAVDHTGAPLLSHYEVQFFMPGAGQPFQTASLGKPQPGGGGMIRYSLSQLVLPSAGIVYRARVASVGPGGSTFSTMSNEFIFDSGSSCSYELSPSTQTVGASGGNVQLTVNVAGGCTWTASSSAAWLRISGGSGNGFGQVTATADSNATSSVRRATITVGGQSAEVTQNAGSGGGGACTVDIQPSAPTIDPAGAVGSLSITSGGSCQWSATSSVPWVVITAQTGAGSGWVSYSIPPNPSASQRTGTVTVNGQSVLFTQLGAGGGGGGGGGCSVSVSPGSVSASAAATAASLTVSSASGCTWSTSTNASWIAITAATGVGSGWVSYSLASNSGAARSGQIVVGNQSVTVNQAGSGGGGGGGGGGSCSATVSPTTVSVGASAATDSLSVSAASGCNWSAVSNAPWIAITAVTGSGSGWVSYNVLSNDTGSARTGTITAAGQAITFTQAASGGGGGGGGGGCSPSVSPRQMSVGSSFTTASFTVNAPATCTWTGTSQANWITVTAVSGRGDGWVSFNVADNNTGGARTGQLTVAGQTVSVTQNAFGGNMPLSACPVSLSGSDIVLAPGGAGGVLGVTSAPDCAWTASTGAAWLTITDGASGSGAATISLQPAGDTSIERSTTVIVGDRTVTVTQKPREAVGAAGR